MPAPIHAVLVVRADSRPATAAHLAATLDAIHAQARRVDALTLVVCGSDPQITKLAQESGAESVISASPLTGFASAVRLAARRIDENSALWLLAQDTEPAPDALARLDARLETALSVVVVAPKLVRASDHTIIESAGVTMTRLGRAVTFGVGQIDQGQHDDTQDVLGADVRGMLIRGGHVASLLPDPALAGADEGLDIGVRARVAGHRVDLAPSAIVAVHNDGVAGLPSPVRPRDRRRIGFSSRVAQLHRRLVYAPAWAVPLHILSFPLLAVWQTLLLLIDKLPSRVLPEWGATALAAGRWPSILRSRRELDGSVAGFKRVAPLRLTRRQVKAVERQSTVEDVAGTKRDLHFFSGGGAWVTLAALVVSVAVFPALLAWPNIGGAALLPLREAVSQLWADTRYGYAGVGLDGVVPADPFATVIALLGSISPTNPAGILVVLWVLALPLAVLGGWFAATRITERSGLRIAAAVMWALAPTFLSALITPRPTAVLVHLILPWFAYAAMIAHRSWGAAAAASLALMAIAACSPSLGVLLVALCIVAALVFVGMGRLRGCVRYLWVVVPAIIWFVPVVWRHIVQGTPLAVLTDPGSVVHTARADDSIIGRLLTTAGFVDADPGHFSSFLSAWDLSHIAPFAAVLVVPMFAVALVSPFTKRWRVGLALVVLATVAALAALVVARISLSFDGGQPVPIWPGALLSAAWLAAILAALVTLDRARLKRAPRSILATAVTALVMLSAVPALTAPARGDTALTQGVTTTLPAFVAAEALDDRAVGTLVLSPQDDGSFLTRIVWGGTDSLGGQSTFVSTRTEVDATDRRVADVVAAIATPGAGVSAESIASLGVRYVLVEPASSVARATAAREAAVASLNLRSGLSRIGETGKGALWRLEGEPAARPALTEHEELIANVITLSGAGIALIAILLAIPTPTSVRASRRKPRIVDARGAEEV